MRRTIGRPRLSTVLCRHHPAAERFARGRTSSSTDSLTQGYAWVGTNRLSETCLPCCRGSQLLHSWCRPRLAGGGERRRRPPPDIRRLLPAALFHLVAKRACVSLAALRNIPCAARGTPTHHNRAGTPRRIRHEASSEVMNSHVLQPGAQRLFALIAPTPNSTLSTLRSSLDAHLRPLGTGSIVRSASRSKWIVPPEPRETIGASWSLQSRDSRKRAIRER